MNRMIDFEQEAADPMDSWLAFNQRYLGEQLQRLRRRLQACLEAGAGESATAADLASSQDYGAGDGCGAAGQEDVPPALELLCSLFGLSEFERDTLLLCAAVELEAGFADLCRSVPGQMAPRGVPTLGLALGLFGDAHWSALTPSAPLRYWRMLEVGAGDTLATSPLRIDERVLHYLTGLRYPDDALTGYVEPVLADGDSSPGLQQALLRELAAAWSSDEQRWPVLQLTGSDGPSRRRLAAQAIANSGLQPYLMRADSLPHAAGDLTVLTRLWEREAILGSAGLVLEWSDVSEPEAAQRLATERFIEQVRCPLVLCRETRQQHSHREVINFELSGVQAEAQRRLWQRELDQWAPGLNGQLGPLVAQFDVGEQTIQTVCRQLRYQFGDSTPGADELSERLWSECRQQLRPSLDSLAQRIPILAGWDDLVLPPRQLETLRDIAAQARQRAKVYEEWGFAEKSARGLGISALFFGPSGTGKTLAAEVLAGALELDLYRIDLSQVVSKYIGETEKNLKRIFDAAEGGSAVLLFDEADALFGKRSEVKDSHDRYANIEVSYLLQRIEAFRGLAILTTNLKDSLDDAFMRRIRFAINFPFPSTEQRAAIWERVFPTRTPTENLVTQRLAQLNITGGNIRNIALYAAFLAAEEDTAVSMQHMLRAARAEYAKLEKPLSDTEVRGWT